MIEERYRHFLAAAQTLHFTKAAEFVFRTQSAISQSVSSLEAEYGTALFFREGRSMRLTEAGHLLTEHCLKAARIEEQCKQDLAQLSGLEKGKLRIGASSTSACYWLPPVLARFRSSYPGITLSILNGSSSMLVQAVNDDACDLAIVTLPIDERNLDIMLLGTREDVLICSPGSKLIPKRPPELADLNGIAFLLPDEAAQTFGFLTEVFKKAGVKVDVVMTVRGLEIIKRYVEQDVGVSIVPRLAVERELAAKTLEAWPLFAAGDFRSMALIQKKRSPANRLVHAFCACI